MHPFFTAHMILLVFWRLPSLVLNLSYSSSLISSLTVTEPGRAVDSWQQLLDQDYHLIVYKNLFMTKLLEVSQSEIILNLINAKLV